MVPNMIREARKLTSECLALKHLRVRLKVIL